MTLLDANGRTEPAFGSAMTLAADVEQWRVGALLEFGDPSEPVCQLFFRWEPHYLDFQGDELVCGTTADGVLMLLVGGGTGLVPLPVRAGEPVIAPNGQLEAFGALQITPDVWALAPSLNVPGTLHGFVVLYGVPTPAPWERLIVLP